VKIIDTDFKGLKVIELDIHSDERGFFCESYNQKKFNELGILNNFIQDNFSKSAPNVVRGLHYQRSPDQAKLVGCISGKIFDVAVDIRPDSKTFGKYFGIELSGDNGKLLMIPAGFAHGFSVTSKNHAHVIYKVDGLYNKSGEGGIKFDDAELGIDWKVKAPIISIRDTQMKSFMEYKNNSAF
jgi:dTDP-4-dehydrorhamnose 3,5-epimerase